MTLDEVRRVLEPSAALGHVTWDDVLGAIKNSEAQLFVGERCAIVTELWSRNGEMDCCHVWIAGGDLKGILKLQPTVEAQAEAWGCKRATICVGPGMGGRRGWERALRRTGFYRRDEEQLEKRLGHRR